MYSSRHEVMILVISWMKYLNHYIIIVNKEKKKGEEVRNRDLVVNVNKKLVTFKATEPGLVPTHDRRELQALAVMKEGCSCNYSLSLQSRAQYRTSITLELNHIPNELTIVKRILGETCRSFGLLVRS